MERYLGSKIVRAEPMDDYAFFRTVRRIPDRIITVDATTGRGADGYKVVYDDGYVSWSPAAPFERAYRRLVGDLGDARVEMIARVAYEANRGWCEAHGDFSFGPWEGAPDWQQGTLRDGVRFTVEHPGAGDSASHDNWMRFKLKDGWTYGPVKDPAAKTHPCLVPFEQLPPEQQVKDRLFRAIVLALASA